MSNRVALALVSTETRTEPTRENDWSDADQLLTEDKTDNNDIRTIREFPLQNIVQDVWTGNVMKFFICWRPYKSADDTVEPLNHNLHNLIANC